MKVGKRARGRTNCGMEGSDQRPSSVRLEDAKSVATRLPKGSNTSESHGIAHSPGLRETIGTQRTVETRCVEVLLTTSFGGAVQAVGT